MFTKIRLPSPALVISFIALVVAVGGGTLAVAALTKPKVKTIAKAQANKQIDRRAPGLSVSHADTADKAGDVTDVASANVAADGTLNAGTPGISVSKDETGHYCIGASFAATAATANISEDSTGFPLAYVRVPANTDDCVASGKTSAEVFTFVSSPFASTPAIHDEPFFVILR
jgi:hypothetical protein